MFIIACVCDNPSRNSFQSANQLELVWGVVMFELNDPNVPYDTVHFLQDRMEDQPIIASTWLWLPLDWVFPTYKACSDC